MSAPTAARQLAWCVCTVSTCQRCAAASSCRCGALDGQPGAVVAVDRIAVVCCATCAVWLGSLVGHRIVA